MIFGQIDEGCAVDANSLRHVLNTIEGRGPHAQPRWVVLSEVPPPYGAAAPLLGSAENKMRMQRKAWKVEPAGPLIRADLPGIVAHALLCCSRRCYAVIQDTHQ